MKCWNCGFDLNPTEKIPFRALCDQCSFYLHCCKNCRNYKPGLPNDCAVPGTEYIADRTANNFCEDFEPLGEGPSHPKISSQDVEKKLFGDEIQKNKLDPKDRFKSLFKDDF